MRRTPRFDSRARLALVGATIAIGVLGFGVVAVIVRIGLSESHHASLTMARATSPHASVVPVATSSPVPRATTAKRVAADSTITAHCSDREMPVLKMDAERRRASAPPVPDQPTGATVCYYTDVNTMPDGSATGKLVRVVGLDANETSHLQGLMNDAFPVPSDVEHCGPDIPPVSGYAMFFSYAEASDRLVLLYGSSCPAIETGHDWGRWADRTMRNYLSAIVGAPATRP